MITIFTKYNCPMCDKLKAWCDAVNIEYEAINCQDHPEVGIKNKIRLFPTVDVDGVRGVGYAQSKKLIEENTCTDMQKSH